jgi:hypothetical protein
MVCYRTLVHLLTFGHYRYRPPMEPYLILFGAFGLFITSREVVRAFRERNNPPPPPFLAPGEIGGGGNRP